MTRYGWVLAASLAATSSLIAQDQTVLLRLSPPPGQISHYRVSTETSVDAAGAGQFSGIQVMFMTQEIVSADSETYTLEMTIDSVTVDGPAAMAMGQAVELLRGLRTSLQMDPRGRVLETTLLDADSNPMLQQIAGVMEQNMPAAVLLPEQPVEPGATWADTNVVDMPVGQASMFTVQHLQYQLLRVEVREGARHAVIGVAGTITQTMEVEGQQGVAMESSGTMQGEIDLDLDAGRWVRNDMTMAMVTEGPMLPGPMTMQVTIRGVLEAL